MAIILAGEGEEVNRKRVKRLMGLMGRTGLVEEPAWLEAGVLGGVFMLTLLSEQTNDM